MRAEPFFFLSNILFSLWTEVKLFREESSNHLQQLPLFWGWGLGGGILEISKASETTGGTEFDQAPSAEDGSPCPFLNGRSSGSEYSFVSDAGEGSGEEPPETLRRPLKMLWAPIKDGTACNSASSSSDIRQDLGSAGADRN